MEHSDEHIPEGWPGQTVPWLELFYDLAFVASLTILTKFVKPSSGPSTLAWVALATATSMLIWLTTALVFNRFPAKDESAPGRFERWRSVRRLIVFLQMGALAVAVISINPYGDDEMYHAGFGAGCVVGLTAAALFALGPRSKESGPTISWTPTVCTAVGSLLLMLGALVHVPPRLALLLMAAALVLLIVSIVIYLKDRDQWMRPHHLIERFGLLVLIVLGEPFLALMLEVTAAGEVESKLLFVSALAVPMAIFIMYFRRPAPIRKHSDQIYLVIVVEFMVALTALGLGNALAKRAATPHYLDLPGSLGRLTSFFVALLVSLILMWLISGHRNYGVPVVYGIGLVVITALGVIGATSGAADSLIAELQAVVLVLTAVGVSLVLNGTRGQARIAGDQIPAE